MAFDIRANTGTMPVREALALDQRRLAEWLKHNIPGFEGPMEVHEFKGGQSNPTYKISTPGRFYVLRRKPPGPLLKGAHAVDREARVLSALETVEFPVPHVYGLCTDDEVIGSWFYVMEMVEGRIFWEATFAEVSRDERPAYFDALNHTIASLHSLDPQAIGLDDYGPHGSYFERQIARWSKQYLADDEAGRDPGMDKLIEWLPQNIPASTSTRLIHGDFRCDNVIFHPTEPRIVAVLDWELSTLGDPLADFTYHAIMYRMPGDIVAGLRGVDLAALNIPGEAEYRDAYLARLGVGPISEMDYNFYLTFNFFRLAAIFHGIKGRMLRGNAASAQAQERAADLPRLITLAVECMNACR